MWELTMFVDENIWRCARLSSGNGGLHAIDPKLNVAPFATDAVVVPLILLQRLVDHILVGRSESLLTARFIVERAVETVALVGLIADHFKMIWDALAAELHAAVD